MCSIYLAWYNDYLINNLAPAMEVHPPPYAQEIIGDPGVHVQALTFFENLRSKPHGYRECMQMLTDGTGYDDSVKHICLNIIKKNYMQYQYNSGTSTERERERMHEFMIQYIYQLQLHDRFDSRNVRYVVARLYVLVFLGDYLHHWDDFFDVLADSTSMGLKAVDHTVRVLHMISFWLAKGDIPPCTGIDAETKELVKAKFERCDLDKVVRFLYFVMSEYHQIAVESLKILCELMTWVDANCFTYSPILEVVASHVGNRKTADLAMNCFIELAKSRTSEPFDKYYLIDKMAAITEKHWSQMEHIKKELYCRYCEFQKEVGKQLILSYEQCVSDGRYCDAQVILAAIESRCVDAVAIMLNSYDHAVVLALIEFPILYVGMLSAASPSAHPLSSGLIATPTDAQQNQVRRLLGACVTQMKCPFYMDVQVSSMYDAFRDYRTRVSQLVRAIVRYDRDLVVGCVGDQMHRLGLGPFTSTLEPYNDIELSAYLLQILCETLPMDREPHNKYSLMNMIQTLVTSDLDTHPHPAVVVQYFSTIVAGAEAFAITPTLIPHILTSFLARSGINHREDVVRDNCAHLWHALAKRLHGQLAHHAHYITERLRPHLELDRRHLLHEAGGGGAQRGQLALYAAAALAILTGEFSPGKRQAHHEQLLALPFNSFRCAMSQWYGSTTSRADFPYRIQLASEIRHTVDAVTHTTYAFAESDDDDADAAFLAVATDCAQNYVTVFALLQHGMQLASTHPEVHSSMATLVERLVLVLDDRLIPFIPSITQGLCSSNHTQCVSETIRVLIRMIDKYNRKIVPFLKEEFQRIGHCIYLPYAIAYNACRDAGSRERYMTDLEDKYILYVRALIRNEIFEEVLLQADKSPLLNILHMIACGCLPRLRVDEEKMKEYTSILRLSEVTEVKDADIQHVVGGIKRLFLETSSTGANKIDDDENNNNNDDNNNNA